MPFAAGSFAPMLRLGYRSEHRVAVRQGMTYADGLDAVDNRLVAPAKSDSAGLAGIGFRLSLDSGLGVDLEYRANMEATSPEDQSIGANVSRAF